MALARLAALHGVATSYSPAPGRTVPATDAAVAAVLTSLGVDVGTPQAIERALAEREEELRVRLLPPTVVWWPGHAPRPLAELPPGTWVRVIPEGAEGENGAVEWVTPERAPGAPEAGAGSAAAAEAGAGAAAGVGAGAQSAPEAGPVDRADAEAAAGADAEAAAGAAPEAAAA